MKIQMVIVTSYRSADLGLGSNNSIIRFLSHNLRVLYWRLVVEGVNY